jgi:riboflavin biosynthesis pyrimidine reductase/pyrimidine deaminase RibD-like protein
MHPGHPGPPVLARPGAPAHSRHGELPHNSSVTNRPYVLLSFATSLDGYLDDATPHRLLLSNAADFDRVDALRASCDAILVGAGTVRADNPRLLVRSEGRRAVRVARGETPSPLRVVLSGSGTLDRAAAVFATEGAETVVYSGGPQQLGGLLDDLGRRGVRRLMVEGGSSVLTAFLAEDLADEIQIAVAPFLIGDRAAPHAFGPGPVLPGGALPGGPGRRMILADTYPIGDVVFARYLSARPVTGQDPAAVDEALLIQTIEISRSCPAASGAYSVGALIVDADGAVISTGYSRELLRGLGDPDKNHAEEVALAKLPAGDPRLKSATLYTSLEPCSPRASRPLSCTDHILAAGVPRVVLALREPALLAVCDGAERLRAAGVEVVEIPALAPLVRAVNAHLLPA